MCDYPRIENGGHPLGAGDCERAEDAGRADRRRLADTNRAGSL
jgi:hypothetical protein